VGGPVARHRHVRVSYQYVKEAFPDASVLKIGLAWPLPERLFREFAAGVSRLVVSRNSTRISRRT